MPTDERETFMAALTKNGYRTHGIGKCHFTPDAMALRGFQTRDVQEESGVGPLESQPYLKHLYDKGYKHLCEPSGIRGEMYYVPQPSQLPPEDHPSQWIGNRSTDFIRENKNSEDPWYLFSSFIHPHPPFTPPNPWHKLYRPSLMPLPHMPDDFEALQTLVNKCQNRYKYRDGGYDKNLVRAIKAYYYACISFVDFQIGRILDELEKTGQKENTMIIFTADHGELLGDYQCFGKRSMHDSCARIPLIINQQGRFDGGVVCDEVASLVDIAPTIMAATGSTITTHPMDGVDLHDILTGDLKREHVYGQLCFNGEKFLEDDDEFDKSIEDSADFRATFSSYMAVSKKWKYFYSAADNREFLFDRKMNGLESRNVVCHPHNQDAKQRMKSSLMDHLKACGETGGIEGDEWKTHKLPPFARDPDQGLLLQDKYTPWVDTYIPGYSDD
jgi:arylsulfatase A-like enzyme